MTPLNALPLQIGTMLPIEAAGGIRCEGREVADFSALLALEPGGTGTLPQSLTASAPDVDTALTDPSNPAILPLPGKVLPPVLPNALPEPAPLVAPDAAELPAATEAPAPAAPPRTAALTAVVLRAVRTARASVADEPAAEAAVLAQADQTAADVPIDLPQTAVQPAPPLVAPQPPLPVEPAVVAAESLPVTSVDPDPEPARRAERHGPTLIRAQAQPAPLPAHSPALAPAPVVPQPVAPAVTLLTAAILPAQPVAATLKIRPGRTVEVVSALAKPSPTMAAPEVPVPGSTPTLLQAPVTIGDPAPTQASAPSIASSEPAARPHDFTALVDRLAAAREAVQPQSVSIAVAHREFGPVRLQFRNEDGALSVALASADPDFARAVAAAPPVQAPAPSEAGSFQPSRSGGDSASGNSGQSRGGTNTAARDDRTPQGNPSSARTPRREGDRQQGIFA